MDGNKRWSKKNNLSENIAYTNGAKKINWAAIRAIEEIVGAVAVLLTIKYLADQIKQKQRDYRRFGVSRSCSCRYVCLLTTFDNFGV